ncbi:OLC1v1029022C1 [Oldenlandia corymbosa var. corymbosa]|uniref:OLC1v1029022C1 n=1 Tax=Oldenlandia corymbosa var. corymbosa TaxID=529605 RepID=A0AAV1CG79_OLDCO|nr:OLC1v1029022C1 [Oldenlandia corymbosa var. corymbosa]
MKSQHPKLKTAPRQTLFSCGFFRHCTQTVLSPTTTTPPSLPFPGPEDHLAQPPTPAPPPPPKTPAPLPPSRSSGTLPGHAPTKPDSESSSSSSNTSQSFTQWRFQVPNSPISHNLIHPYPSSTHESPSIGFDPNPPVNPPFPVTHLEETFHVAELQFSSGSYEDKLAALRLLEMSLVPNPRAAADGGEPAVSCPATVMKRVLDCLKEKGNGKSASKVLLALCLAEENRHVAVEVGAVGAVIDAMSDLEGAVAERSLAALELLCTVAEGAAELRTHALAVPMMVEVMGRMEGRGKEYAISVLTVIFSGANDVVAPPEEVARAVMLALQGDCSARGRRKGSQLLKILQEEHNNNGRLEFAQDGQMNG